MCKSNRTTERLLTRTSQQMCLEVTSCSASVATLIALERLFSRMFPHVCLEKISSCARVLALVATVGLNCILQRSFKIFCHFNFQIKRNDGVICKVEG